MTDTEQVTVPRGMLKAMAFRAIDLMSEREYQSFAAIVLAAMGVTMDGKPADGGHEFSPDEVAAASPVAREWMEASNAARAQVPCR